MFKALTSEYRDRIKFAYASKKDVLKQFPEIQDYPSLLALESYDVDKE